MSRRQNRTASKLSRLLLQNEAQLDRLLTSIKKNTINKAAVLPRRVLFPSQNENPNYTYFQLKEEVSAVSSRITQISEKSGKINLPSSGEIRVQDLQVDRYLELMADYNRAGLKSFELIAKDYQEDPKSKELACKLRTLKQEECAGMQSLVAALKNIIKSESRPSRVLDIAEEEVKRSRINHSQMTEHLKKINQKQMALFQTYIARIATKLGLGLPSFDSPEQSAAWLQGQLK